MPSSSIRDRAVSSLTRQAFLSFLAPLLALAAAAVAANAMLGTSKSQQREARQITELIRQHERFLGAVERAASAYRNFLLTGESAYSESFDAAVASVQRHLATLRGHATPQADNGHAAYTAQVEGLFQRWREEATQPLMAKRRDLPVGLAAESFILHARLNRLADRLTDAWQSSQPAVREGWRESLHAAVLRLKRVARRAQATEAAERWRTLSERAEQADQRLDAADDNADVFHELITSLQARTRYLAEETANAELTLKESLRSGPSTLLIERIRARTDEHLSDLEAKQKRAITESVELTRLAQWITTLAPAGGLLLGLAVAVYLIYGVIRDIRTVSTAARDLADGTLSTNVDVKRDDELGELAASFNRMRMRLAERQDMEDAFGRFEAAMLSVRTPEEALIVVARFSGVFFPGTVAQIYRMSESRNRLDWVGGWGESAIHDRPPTIEPEDCLALRTGRDHRWHHPDAAMPCPHHLDPAPTDNVCLPLRGQEQALGLLTIERWRAADEPGSAGINYWLAHRVADQLGLVLANLDLHERLRSQSIRDPLTGLFNRRYMDETLEREMERSRRTASPLAVIALDIDHFKTYNDQYGHEAGDKVLQTLAGILAKHVRGSDIACRAGGEEFILVLPSANADLAAQRADQLRERVAGTAVTYGNTELPPVTISLGVAAMPPDPDDALSLIRQADQALYQAKRNGRNCVRRADATQ